MMSINTLSNNNAASSSSSNNNSNNASSHVMTMNGYKDANNTSFDSSIQQHQPLLSTNGTQQHQQLRSDDAQFIASSQNEDFFWRPEIVYHCSILWNVNEPAIIEAFALRNRLQLLDSSAYLFDHAARIGAPNYTPTESDILHARLRTSGIVERTLQIHGTPFTFIDVGGQRNERRKWIHCFSSVTCVMFVSAISEFDQTLFEDSHENRLIESLRVFESVANNAFFHRTPLIVFLNKYDLFELKLKHASIRSVFPHYLGADDDPHEAAMFIRREFIARNRQVDRQMFVHTTCATDTNNIERVFEACRQVILQENLKKLGLS